MHADVQHRFFSGNWKYRYELGLSAPDPAYEIQFDVTIVKYASTSTQWFICDKQVSIPSVNDIWDVLASRSKRYSQSRQQRTRSISFFQEPDRVPIWCLYLTVMLHRAKQIMETIWEIMTRKCVLLCSSHYLNTVSFPILFISIIVFFFKAVL